MSDSRPFSSVLVANRSEIALRIMRTARKLGLRTIAVYTEADAGAEYVEFADQAILIGEGPVAESYLSIHKILEAAKQSKAQAIHPGYGFLSESAEFAKAVAKAGLVFVGPSASAIAAMGNKAEAKRRMIKAGVPCVPGYEGSDQSDDAFAKAASSIGYPVMIKAAAGGGGRGMRMITAPDGLTAGLALARSEADSAFGSGELILEKAIERSRHVEIQVFADRQGDTLHLGERDCSVQRRHQKVIEEAPSPAVSEELRTQMGQAAIKAAQAIDYEGAGTVEFLLGEDGAFYFLEMNTRLQVEHPVTEMVTGLDLVAMQFDIAQEQPLPLTQDEVTLTGHAIEVRLYAEDPAHDFLPDSGRVELWQPATGPMLRIDSGVHSTQVVSPYYDSMLAKVIAHGTTRDAARKTLIDGLKSCAVFGLKTNRDFLIELLEEEGFANGKATTAFIAETYGDAGPRTGSAGFDIIATAAVLAYRELQQRAFARSPMSGQDLLGWSSTGQLKSRMKLGLDDRVFDLHLTQSRDGRIVVSEGEEQIAAVFESGTLRIDDQRCEVAAFLLTDGKIYLATGGTTLALNRISAADIADEVNCGNQLLAPMPGNLTEVFVKPGQAIVKGDRLAVLEAMKMQHELLAEADGIVSNISVSAGQQVRAGEVLIEIELPVDRKDR